MISSSSVFWWRSHKHRDRHTNRRW